MHSAAAVFDVFDCMSFKFIFLHSPYIVYIHIPKLIHIVTHVSRAEIKGSWKRFCPKLSQAKLATNKNNSALPFTISLNKKYTA